MQTAEGKLYLFVGIDRTSKFAVTQLIDKADRRTAWEFLEYAVQLGYLRHPGRALEPGEMPPAAMLTVLAAQIGCSPDAFADYAARDTTLREHRAAIERRLGLRTFERADRGMVFMTASEVTISPLRRSTPDEAEELKARLYGLLPRIRITDLLAEVSAWTGFAERFVHARSGMAASDQPALMGAILADGTNLGLARMAESSRGLTHGYVGQLR